MKKSKLQTSQLIFTSSFLIFLSDQITKFWALNNQLPIYFNNESIVFGLIPVGIVGVVLTGVLQIVLAVFYYLKIRNMGQPVAEIALGLFIGGSLGNKADRLFRGGAIDWIDVKIWPIFNIADIAIVAGLLLMGYYLFIWKKS